MAKGSTPLEIEVSKLEEEVKKLRAAIDELDSKLVGYGYILPKEFREKRGRR